MHVLACKKSETSIFFSSIVKCQPHELLAASLSLYPHLSLFRCRFVAVLVPYKQTSICINN